MTETARRVQDAAEVCRDLTVCRTCRNAACRSPCQITSWKGLSDRERRWHVSDVPIRIPSLAFELAPRGTKIVRAERMSPAFIKYHLDNGCALHRFVRPEPHVHPHDHPWRFETTILLGGYVEEVFTLLPDRTWRSTLVERVQGSCYSIEASHIHRIVSLPQGESWTIVRAGPHERTTLFWRFADTVRYRAWNARHWRHYWPPLTRSDRSSGRRT